MQYISLRSGLAKQSCTTMAGLLSGSACPTGSQPGRQGEGAVFSMGAQRDSPLLLQLQCSGADEIGSDLPVPIRIDFL